MREYTVVIFQFCTVFLRHGIVRLFICLFVDASDWRAFVIGQDDSCRSIVRLCGMQSGRRFCINDLLVQHEYAAAVSKRPLGMLLPGLQMQLKNSG